MASVSSARQESSGLEPKKGGENVNRTNFVRKGKIK